MFLVVSQVFVHFGSKQLPGKPTVINGEAIRFKQLWIILRISGFSDKGFLAETFGHEAVGLKNGEIDWADDGLALMRLKAGFCGIEQGKSDSWLIHGIEQAD